MGIGASIFLIAVGAILTFALERDISGLDIDVFGVILMLAGAAGLFMTLVVWGPRSRIVRLNTTALTPPHPPSDVVPPQQVVPPQVIVEERRVYEENPPL